MHKRKTLALMLVIFIATVLFASCKDDVLPKTSYRDNSGEFSVHFLDVGQGDCALIYFPDGKTMLIDTGNGKEENNEYILEFLDGFGIDNIDFLVLTHPDIDHIGGVTAIAQNISVSLAYVPFILNLNNFLDYKTGVDALTAKGTTLKTSCTYEKIVGNDYTVAFLTPYPPDFNESSYDYINKDYPTESEINNVSPLIYVEYKGVRFLFTGDAGASEEQFLLDDEWKIVGLFEMLDVNVNLDSIDFLKVAHHGSNDSTSENFIKRLTPKNAIISVGGLNSYGHPSSKVLQRLNEFSPAHNLYRTDVYGTISVFVDSKASIKVVTD